MHEIQRLIPRHYKMIELALTGASNRSIAAAAGVGEANVGMVLNSPIAMAELARRRKGMEKDLNRSHAQGLNRVKDILTQGAEAAAGGLVSLAKSAESESVRRASCADILDRVLDNSPKAAGVVNITVESLQLLQVALAESGEVAAA